MKLALLWPLAIYALSFSHSNPLVAAATTHALVSTNIVYPASVGVLNVRDAKYGARGDGKTDDTRAIQKALTDGLYSHHVVYVPNGIYLVSDTLKWQNPANAGDNTGGWGPFLQMQGQSRGGTIIRLKSSATGYSDASSPKAVLQTGSSGSDGNKHYTNGEGNEAFENHLRDFTVDTGRGNPGAIGIDYQASNVGAMRHITIRSGDSTGYCGVNLTRRDNGPGMLKDIRVEGFRFGIRTYQEIAHFTLEDIQLKGQSEAGIWARDSIIAARHVFSMNDVPAIQLGGTSVLALFDSTLRGTGSAAIMCEGTAPSVYVRSLETPGYKCSVRLRGATQGPHLSEWSSDLPKGDARGRLSLKLPIRDTPEWYDPIPAHWVDVGSPTGEDDTAQIQKALDSGKNTVCFRYGTYHLRDTLMVPGTVKLLMGIGTSLDLQLPDDKPAIQFAGGHAGQLTIVDRIYAGGKAGALFDHVDARTLVLRDIMPSTPAYRNHVGAGPVFFEDVTSAGYSFAPGTKAWARQFNAEGVGNPKAVNDGATLWVLGWKTEGGDTLLENKNGGRGEVWGALAYSFGVGHDVPMFNNTDSSLAAQATGMTYMGANGFYDLMVRDSQGGVVQETRVDGSRPRGGKTLPLFVSGTAKTNPVVTKR